MIIDFRPLAEPDLPLLADWLGRPHVRQWWAGDQPLTLTEVRAKYLPRIDDTSAVRCFIALASGEPIGFIQSYVAMACGDGWWPDETDLGVRGIDQFLADGQCLGRGLGTAMVKAFIERLFADPRVTRIQTDPDPSNSRAIRCYEKAGFRRIGEVITPDGPALLMSVTR